MNKDIFLSIIVCIFATFFLFFSVRLPSAKIEGQVGAGGWPSFVLTAMLLLGILLLFQSVWKKNAVKKNSLKNSNGVDKKHNNNQKQAMVEADSKQEIYFLSRYLLVFLLMAGYLFLVPFVGFAVATFLLISILAWAYGMKKSFNIILTGMISSLFFSYVFITMLGLALPKGMAVFYTLNSWLW